MTDVDIAQAHIADAAAGNASDEAGAREAPPVPRQEGQRKQQVEQSFHIFWLFTPAKIGNPTQYTKRIATKNHSIYVFYTFFAEINTNQEQRQPLS
jgi:hypothetical protein